MKIDLVTRREDLPNLYQEWEELAHNDRRDGFFRTPAWCIPWMEHIRPDAQPFVVVARDGEGRIAGLAPLCKLTYKDHGFRLGAVSPMGREVVSGDFLEYVTAANVRQEATRAILDHLWEMRSEWEILVAGEVYQDGELHGAIGALADRENLPIRLQEDRVCPYIELPSSFEEYLRSLSQKMRYEIRHDTREVLEKCGGVVKVFTQQDAAREQIDTMIRLHLAHWQRVNEPGTMGRPGFAEFLKQVCGAPPKGATTRLYLLEHEGKDVAALLAFWYGENAMFYQTGWDPDSALARLSPGMVLVARAIRDAIEGGFRYFDFLRGDETYKTRLTKTSRKTTTLLVARSFIAKEYLRASRMKDSVKRLFTTDSPQQAEAPAGSRK